jgi:hypothetical protein
LTLGFCERNDGGREEGRGIPENALHTWPKLASAPKTNYQSLMTTLLKVQIRHCPVCKTTVNWGKKVGRCKCPGKFWPRKDSGKDRATESQMLARPGP